MNLVLFCSLCDKHKVKILHILKTKESLKKKGFSFSSQGKVSCTISMCFLNTSLSLSLRCIILCCLYYNFINIHILFGFPQNHILVLFMSFLFKNYDTIFDAKAKVNILLCLKFQTISSHSNDNESHVNHV